MSGLTVITPTHDRPIAFDLCQRWMERQSFDGEVQWIVADGGDTPVTCRLGQTHIRTAPVECGPESFRKNYNAALAAVKFDRIVFIEDDDWYHADYLKRLSELFDHDVDVVGQCRPRYYNVRYRKYMIHTNATRRTSLCQMGIRAASIIPMMRWLQEASIPIYFDSYFWRHLREFGVQTILCDPESTHVTAIKGVTGSAGVGIGHSENSNGIMHLDPTGEKLREWVGEDASVYLEMYQK